MAVSAIHELRRQHDVIDDALAPARGIVIGLMLSVALWTLVALVATRL
jgi:hypothetical protein